MTSLVPPGTRFQRSDYPLGFLVVALVLPSQAACQEEGEGGLGELGEGGEEAWLWAAALLGDEPQRVRLVAREKDFVITVEVKFHTISYICLTSIEHFLRDFLHMIEI